LPVTLHPVLERHTDLRVAVIDAAAVLASAGIAEPILLGRVPVASSVALEAGAAAFDVHFGTGKNPSHGQYFGLPLSSVP